MTSLVTWRCALVFIITLSFLCYIASSQIMERQRKAQSREELLLKKRITERLRYQKIKSDPQLSELQKTKERQKYLRRRREKKILSIKEMTPEQQRLQRKKWRDQQKRSRRVYVKKNKEFAGPNKQPSTVIISGDDNNSKDSDRLKNCTDISTFLVKLEKDDYNECTSSPTSDNLEDFKIDEEEYDIAELSQNSVNFDAQVIEESKSSKDKKSDDFQVFGDFVAAELRSLRSNECQKKLKRIIQKAILQIAEEDDVLNG